MHQAHEQEVVQRPADFVCVPFVARAAVAGLGEAFQGMNQASTIVRNPQNFPQIALTCSFLFLHAHRNGHIQLFAKLSRTRAVTFSPSLPIPVRSIGTARPTTRSRRRTTSASSGWRTGRNISREPTSRSRGLRSPPRRRTVRRWSKRSSRVRRC